MSKIKSIVIIGRLWFDKVNGNTYFSSEGIVDGIEKATILFEYGYGDHYEHQTFKKLFPNVDDQPWKYCKDNNINYICISAMVQRKKDL